MSQGEFGKKIGKPQPVVNRNENAAYGKFTLHNLLEIAEKLDVAVHVRFVDFKRFIELTEDLSETALKPTPYYQVSSGVSLEVDSRNIIELAPAVHVSALEEYESSQQADEEEKRMGIANKSETNESETAAIAASKKENQGTVAGLASYKARRQASNNMFQRPSHEEGAALQAANSH